MYLTYQALTTIYMDFIVLGVLITINFLTDRIKDKKALNKQLLNLLIKSISSLATPWMTFDLIYKTQFMEQLASVLGNGVSFDQLKLFSLFDGLTLFGLIVGSIGIGTLVVLFVTIWEFGYMVYLSKKQAV